MYGPKYTNFGAILCAKESRSLHFLKLVFQIGNAAQNCPTGRLSDAVVTNLKIRLHDYVRNFYAPNMDMIVLTVYIGL